MEIRTACSPADEKYYDTARLRKEFLIDDLFKEDENTNKQAESGAEAAFGGIKKERG